MSYAAPHRLNEWTSEENVRWRRQRATDLKTEG